MPEDNDLFAALLQIIVRSTICIFLWNVARFYCFNFVSLVYR